MQETREPACRANEGSETGRRREGGPALPIGRIMQQTDKGPCRTHEGSEAGLQKEGTPGPSCAGAVHPTKEVFESSNGWDIPDLLPGGIGRSALRLPLRPCRDADRRGICHFFQHDARFEVAWNRPWASLKVVQGSRPFCP